MQIARARPLINDGFRLAKGQAYVTVHSASTWHGPKSAVNNKPSKTLKKKYSTDNHTVHDRPPLCKFHTRSRHLTMDFDR